MARLFTDPNNIDDNNSDEHLSDKRLFNQSSNMDTSYSTLNTTYNDDQSIVINRFQKANIFLNCHF